MRAVRTILIIVFVISFGIFGVSEQQPGYYCA